MPSITPISARSSAELQRTHQPTPSAHGNRSSDTPSTPSTPQTPVVREGGDALPAETRHGSTKALLSRRPGAKTQQPSSEETPARASDDHADGATIVQPGNPTALLMDIQKIQSVMGMVQGAEQGLASMTTSASRSAVDAVQDIAA